MSSSNKLLIRRRSCDLNKRMAFRQQVGISEDLMLRTNQGIPFFFVFVYFPRGDIEFLL